MLGSTQKQKLSDLRALFPKYNIGVYVVLTQDEHQSEYTAKADNRREYLSGFTGSAGTAVVSEKSAFLATDSRYFLQAEAEIDSSCWKLLKLGLENVPSWQEAAVAEAIQLNTNIGVDPKLISYSDVVKIRDIFKVKGAQSLDIVPITDNLVDQVWGPDKPQRSKEPVWILEQKYTGKSFQDKIKQISEQVETKDGTALIVTALDDVAWLFNLRSLTDITFNPVFFAYAVVQPHKTACLYVNSDKISEKVAAYLDEDVRLCSYESFWTDLAVLSKELALVNEKAEVPKKLLIPNTSSWAVVEKLGGADNCNMIKSPVEITKGIKNETEIAAAKLAQIRDGAALVKYLAWLELELKSKRRLTDYDGAVKLHEFRAQVEHFLDLSFGAISSSGPMAALNHYQPKKDSKYYIEENQVYLIDSGGQYFEGTTDITRTLHYGTPDPREIEAYTLVLKGHIALACAVFPESGSNTIDALARQFLWKYGLDYRHGTGHGIGACLNVHEGPRGISLTPGEVPIKAGFLLSDEPGYYEDGKFGIRIESDMIAIEKDTKYKFGGMTYLGFEVITKVPFCQNLIDRDLLTSEEKQWINEYHEDVYTKLRPYFKEGDYSLEYLRRETKPIF